MPRIGQILAMLTSGAMLGLSLAVAALSYGGVIAW